MVNKYIYIYILYSLYVYILTSANTVKPIIASLIEKICPIACNKPTTSFASKNIQFNATKKPTKDNIQNQDGGLFLVVDLLI